MAYVYMHMQIYDINIYIYIQMFGAVNVDLRHPL